MRNKKVAKIAALLLAAAMVAGCGNGGNAGTTAAGTTTGTTAGSEETKGGDETKAPSKEGEEKIVTLAGTGPWEALHPFLSNRDTHVAFLYPMYESWVTTTASGEIKPRLFESWEQSEDGSTLTCKLNEKATWSDGEPITAHDVEFTMQLASDPKLDPAGGRQVVNNFVGTDDQGVQIEGEELGVKALDDYTVELKFKEDKTSTVLAEFYNLRYTYTLPKHCLEDIPVEKVLTDKFWENPVTSGAFTLDNIISGERMEYVAREDYYLGKPQMDRLIIRVIPANNILSAMLAGEVDGTVYGSLMSYSDYLLAKDNPDLVCTEKPGFGNAHILLNNEKLDQNMRLAIDHAINKESIINDVLYGYARPAISAIVPENPYRNENVEGNPYDPEKAKEYLAQSSYDTSKPLTFIMSSANTLGQTIAVLVQQQLAAIGLQMTIETYDAATINSKLFDGEFDLGLMGSASTPFEPSESRFYFQLAPNGWNRITDEKWLDVYAEGLKGLTTEERKPAYDKLQEMLVEEVPMVFLYHADMLFVNSKKISGMPYDDFSLKGWAYETWTVE